MDGIDTEVLQVLDSPWLGQGKVLTRVFCLRTCYREITMVHLIDDIVLERTQHMAVVSPSLGVGITHVQDNPFLTIHRYRLGEHTGRSLSVDDKLVGFPFLVTFQGCCPDTVLPKSHPNTVVVDDHHALGISRCE